MKHGTTPEMASSQGDAGWLSVRAVWGYSTALAVMIADQWSKWLATSMLEYRKPLEVTPWFDLMLTHNTGAAFSFLAGAGGWQRWFFALIAMVVSVVIVIWLSRLPQTRFWIGLALGLVLGGGLGNVWDRLAHGYVVDFISVHYGGWYWPAFNLADSAICAGAFLLILDSFLERRPANPTVEREHD